jgi:uncharacterized protein YndB with AHSA1/START domain
MKMTECIVIEAPPEQVWSWLADPALWARWNPKVKRVKRSRTGAVVAAEVFEADFALSGTATTGQVEVKVCEPFQRLALQQWVDVRGRARSLGVEFALSVEGAETRLLQTTDFADTGLPWPVKLLVGIINRFGRTVGRSHLEELKLLAEAQREAA